MGLDRSWVLEKQELRVVADLAGALCGAAGCRSTALGACTRLRPCGHMCAGVRGEAASDCPPCNERGCGGGESSSSSSSDEICAICHTTELRAAPCLQLQCGHRFHASCARQRVEALPGGGEEVAAYFAFLTCPMCAGRGGASAAPSWGGVVRARDMEHAALVSALVPGRELREEVRSAARQWLAATGRGRAPELAPGGQYEGRPTEFALSIFRFFRCYRCLKPYFGGERQCGEPEAGGPSGRSPRENRVCGGCVAAADGARCKKGHSPEFLQWKCRSAFYTGPAYSAYYQLA